MCTMELAILIPTLSVLVQAPSLMWPACAVYFMYLAHRIFDAAAGRAAATYIAVLSFF